MLWPVQRVGIVQARDRVKFSGAMFLHEIVSVLGSQARVKPATVTGGCETRLQVLTHLVLGDNGYQVVVCCCHF